MPSPWAAGSPITQAGRGTPKVSISSIIFCAPSKRRCAQKDIDGDGEVDRLVPAGIAWMQGESDAFTEPVAKRYEANLRKVMSRIRETLVSDDADHAAKLPIVIGRIVDSGKDADGKMMDFCEIVQEAQAAYVKSDPRSAFIDGTAKYKFSDAWHYDSTAYIDLGQQFADALHKLNAP